MSNHLKWPLQCFGKSNKPQKILSAFSSTKMFLTHDKWKYTSGRKYPTLIDTHGYRNLERREKKILHLIITQVMYQDKMYFLFIDSIVIESSWAELCNFYCFAHVFIDDVCNFWKMTVISFTIQDQNYIRIRYFVRRDFSFEIYCKILVSCNIFSHISEFIP